jgi:hypothetical protein
MNDNNVVLTESINNQKINNNLSHLLILVSVFSQNFFQILDFSQELHTNIITNCGLHKITD